MAEFEINGRVFLSFRFKTVEAMLAKRLRNLGEFS